MARATLTTTQDPELHKLHACSIQTSVPPQSTTPSIYITPHSACRMYRTHRRHRSCSQSTARLDERARRCRDARASPRGVCRREAAEAQRTARLQEQGVSDRARFERAARGAALRQRAWGERGARGLAAALGTGSLPKRVCALGAARRPAGCGASHGRSSVRARRGGVEPRHSLGGGAISRVGAISARALGRGPRRV